MRVSGVKFAYATVLMAGIVYAFISLRGPNGISGMLEKQRIVRQYERENADLQREIAVRQQRILQLERDPAAQESAIRERWKLAAPGEKVFIIDEHAK